MANTKIQPYTFIEPQQTRPNRSATPYLLIFILTGVLVPCLIAYGMGTISEFQVLAAVLALLGVMAVLAKPFWGLLVFVALLYTRPEESIPALASMHFTLLVALLTLGAMLIKMFLDKERLTRTPMAIMIVGFGVAGVLSALPTGDVPTAFQDISRLVVLVLLIINMVRTPEHYRGLVVALLLFTGYLATYSIYLYATGQTFLQDGVVRTEATGIFSDPNDLATTFVAGLALAFASIMQSRGLLRGAYVGLAGLLLYATLLTQSRGGMVALAVVVIGYVAFANIPRSAKIGLAVAGLCLYVAMGASRATNFDSTEDSANSRFWFWTNGYNQLMEHPITGVGYNQFASLNGGMVAHNSFVQCFAELGLLGYFFWMGCIYYGFKRSAPSEDPEADSLASPVSANLFGARMGMVGYLTASFWLTHTYIPVLYVIMCLPVTAQICEVAPREIPKLTAAEHGKDWMKIALISVGSIMFIAQVAAYYR